MSVDHLIKRCMVTSGSPFGEYVQTVKNVHDFRIYCTETRMKNKYLVRYGTKIDEEEADDQIRG